MTSICAPNQKYSDRMQCWIVKTAFRSTKSAHEIKDLVDVYIFVWRAQQYLQEML